MYHSTVLFVDIVDSTKRAAEIGDRRWADLLESFYAVVRKELARYRGRDIDTAGDGFFVTFDGPARAIRCAMGLIEAVERLELQVRVGIHTGEVERIADSAGGLAVVIGSGSAHSKVAWLGLRLLGTVASSSKPRSRTSTFGAQDLIG